VNLKWTNRVSIDTGPRSQGADNPDKTWQLTRCGVTVADQQPTGVHLSPTNSGYLAAKVSRGAHTDLPEAEIFEELEAALRSWQIAEALLRLSAQHCQTLEACYYRGHTVAEAAAMFGVPEGTIMSRLHYGLRALRLVLAEMGVVDSG
jgi:DNA-directed RNA polymerase specialized sigma24 family protein